MAMPNEFRGERHGAGHRFAIVVSQYNEAICSKLLSGAVETLKANGVSDGDIDVVWTPGAWEIPIITDRLARSRRYAAVLCLGAVIRGETSHDQHINRQVSNSLGDIALQSGVPIAFGVLTCNSVEQAVNRAGGTHGNKGEECALAALEMANLLKKLPNA
jgi:6,7-dimethyl-8-ribityllumazine synthase